MTWKNGEYQPIQERADEKKSRLLDAGLELFSTVGYHGTNARDIAARAGVATGSFYRYFRDKKALFMAVCLQTETEMGQEIFDMGRKLREKGASERDVLKQLVKAAVAIHHHNAAFHREVQAMQIKDADIAARGREREQRFLNELGAFLKERRTAYAVKDFEAMAELLFCSIEAVAHRAVLFESPVGEKRLVRELQKMLSDYLFHEA